MGDLQWVLLDALLVLQGGVSDVDVDIALGEGLFGGAAARS